MRGIFLRGLRPLRPPLQGACGPLQTPPASNRADGRAGRVAGLAGRGVGRTTQVIPAEVWHRRCGLLVPAVAFLCRGCRGAACCAQGGPQVPSQWGGGGEAPGEECRGDRATSSPRGREIPAKAAGLDPAGDRGRRGAARCAPRRRTSWQQGRRQPPRAGYHYRGRRPKSSRRPRANPPVQAAGRPAETPYKNGTRHPEDNV